MTGFCIGWKNLETCTSVFAHVGTFIKICAYIYIYAYSSYVAVCFIVAICRTDLACPADPDIVFRLPGLPGESHRGISSENPGAVSVTVFSLGEGWVFQAAVCVFVSLLFFSCFFPLIVHIIPLGNQERHVRNPVSGG